MLFSFTKEKAICIFKFPGLTPCYKQTSRRQLSTAQRCALSVSPALLLLLHLLLNEAPRQLVSQNTAFLLLWFFVWVLQQSVHVSLGRESLVYISSQGSCLNPPGQSGEGSGCNGAEM